MSFQFLLLICHHKKFESRISGLWVDKKYNTWTKHCYRAKKWLTKLSTWKNAYRIKQNVANPRWFPPTLINFNLRFSIPTTCKNSMPEIRKTSFQQKPTHTISLKPMDTFQLTFEMGTLYYTAAALNCYQWCNCFKFFWWGFQAWFWK